ncbi:uncharacterized protein LOC131014036, partial [Salvia miltiorrhiza]|uniref:uncharacterized protein LOC131014036 n=1 Tax=Salvia miltiorrhiza TaxID=226208 RepID=UPI0025AC63BA
GSTAAALYHESLRRRRWALKLVRPSRSPPRVRPAGSSPEVATFLARYYLCRWASWLGVKISKKEKKAGGDRWKSLSEEQMTLIKAQAGVKNNMRRLNTSTIWEGSSHVMHVILFALLLFFLVYFWSKLSRR